MLCTLLFFVYIAVFVTCILLRSTCPLPNDTDYVCVGTPVHIVVKYTTSQKHGWYAQYSLNFNDTMIMNPPECVQKQSLVYTTHKFKTQQDVQEQVNVMIHNGVVKTYPTDVRDFLNTFIFFMVFVMFFWFGSVCVNGVDVYEERRYLLA